MARPSCSGCSTPAIPAARSARRGTPRKSSGRIYEITDPDLAGEFVDQLGVDLQDESCPPEVRLLGRTIVRWRDQIVAWHTRS